MANVERGDHDPNAARPTNSDELGETANDSADMKAHGTHGRGHGTEKRIDDDPVEPPHAGDNARGTDAWGSEPSGGSTIDKRSP